MSYIEMVEKVLAIQMPILLLIFLILKPVTKLIV